MKQRPKPCPQPLQLRVWTPPSRCLCCICSAWVGGGVGCWAQAHHQGSCPEDAGREAESLVCLFSLNLRHELVSKQEIKLAYWVPYSQTICPRHRTDPQGQPEGNRCSWEQGLFLFFQAGLKSASSIYMNPCTLSLHRQGGPVTSPTPLRSARH